MYDSRSVHVRHSRLHGRGLFARKCFLSGDVVLSFDGQTVAIDDLSPAFLRAGDWLPLSRTRCLVLKPGEPLQAINHQAHPNMAVDCKRWRLVALRTIPIDVEMTIDYFATEVDERCHSIRRSFAVAVPSTPRVAGTPAKWAAPPPRDALSRRKLFSLTSEPSEKR